jgi:hypothetical protein
MKPLHLLVLLYTGLSLLGCATHDKSVPPPKTNTLAKKDPIAIIFYPHGKKPPNHYTVLGEGTVSKINQSGFKKQTASIHYSLRNLAVSMGGDAIINIKHHDKFVTGTVIAYQKPHTEPESSA